MLTRVCTLYSVLFVFLSETDRFAEASSDTSKTGPTLPLSVLHMRHVAPVCKLSSRRAESVLHLSLDPFVGRPVSNGKRRAPRILPKTLPLERKLFMIFHSFSVRSI